MTARPSSHSSISYFLDDAAEHSSDSSDEEAQQGSYDRESSFIDDDELSDNELRERWLTRYIHTHAATAAFQYAVLSYTWTNGCAHIVSCISTSNRHLPPPELVTLEALLHTPPATPVSLFFNVINVTSLAMV